MENKFTKGTFEDGTKGWKVNKLGQHWNNKELEHIEIIWSDDKECVCDVVYSEADAKLIAAAPFQYEKHNENISLCDKVLEYALSGDNIKMIETLSKIKSNSIDSIKKATE